MKTPIISALLPTVNPKQMFKLVIPSLVNIQEVKEYLQFDMNFQYPWDKKSIKKAVTTIEDLGFKCKYSYNSYDSSNGVLFNKIRNDCAEKCEDYDTELYMNLDDDMTFGTSTKLVKFDAGDQLLQAINYMLLNKDCGVLKLGGALVKYPPKYHTGIISHYGDVITGKGLIFRNLHLKENKSPIFPDDSLNLLGSDEEKVIAASRFIQGMFIARQGFFHSRHYENRKSTKVKVTSGEELYHWAEKFVKEANNWKFIKEHYFVSGEGDKLNLSSSGKLISDSLYKGLDPSEETSKYPYTIDYSESTTDEIKSSINKLVDL